MKNISAQFRVKQNGPLEVSGNFIIVNQHGEEITISSPAYLCRCGGSADKPFCDGSHRRNGFHG